MKENIIIRDGTIIDGTGKNRFKSDIKIEGYKISEINRKIVPTNIDKVINANGKIICPGFIDIHNHADFYLLNNDHASFLKPFCYQGISTLICGNCGFSAFPTKNDMLEEFKKFNDLIILGDIDINWETCDQYLNTLEEKGILFNFIPLLGHGTLRTVFANGSEKLSRSQVEVIKQKISQSLETR